MSSSDIIIAQFNKVNPDSRKRYPSRDMRVSQQIKNEEMTRVNELKYIDECKKKNISKEQFLFYVINCIHISELHLSMMKRILTQANKMQESTGKNIDECINHLMYDVNGNWAELYSQNENKRCLEARKVRMKSNTYDFKVQNHFNRLDLSSQQPIKNKYSQQKQNLEKKDDLKKKDDDKKKSSNSTKSLKQKKEELFENGEIAMVLSTAGDGIVIATLSMLHEKNFNIKNVDLETVKYANSLRFKKVATKRFIPTKLDQELIENSNFVLISGGRVIYIFEGNMHRQIIRHWNRNIFGGNGIDRDIIFDEDSDYEQDSQIEFEKGSDDESNDDSEDDFDYEIDNILSKFTSNSYENKRRDKEKKDKKKSADRKFHKNKKKASKKVEYNVPLQYIQELLNKLLVDIGKGKNEDEELSFYGKEEDNTVGESSKPSEPIISFYRPGNDSEAETESDSEVWEDSDYESDDDTEVDPSVMKDMGC